MSCICDNSTHHCVGVFYELIICDLFTFFGLFQQITEKMLKYKNTRAEVNVNANVKKICRKYIDTRLS